MDHGSELISPILDILEIEVFIFPRILEILQICRVTVLDGFCGEWTTLAHLCPDAVCRSNRLPKASLLIVQGQLGQFKWFSINFHIQIGFGNIFEYSII